MSFRTPALLLGLVVLPMLVAWYLREQRSRGRAAASFAPALMLASVAPHQPGWRRHAAPLAMLLALALLVLAAARPRVAISAAVGRLSIMLATDVSGSMQATDVAPSRVRAAQRAADDLVTGVPATVKVGVLEFNQNPLLLQAPTYDRLALYGALGQLRTGGGTAIGSAVQAALSVLARVPAAPGSGPTGALVLLSDGYSTGGPDPLAAARLAGRRHVPIFTVALGTSSGTIAVTTPSGRSLTKSVPPDPRSLGQLAQLSGGRAYTAADAGRLSQIYRQLGTQLGHARRRSDITAYFIVAGLSVLAVGAALSLRWFGRFI